MPFVYAALALAVVMIGVSYAVFLMVFRSPYKRQNDDLHLPDTEQMAALRGEAVEMIRKTAALPFERVLTTSFDGLRLAGRYYAAGCGAPLAILFHGYRGTPTRDFSGGISAYLEEGFAVLAVEERAHCSSGGRALTMGVKERRDCLSWIGYANERFGSIPILLCGISMGAATVIMAAGMELPDNVRGVIADSPYTDPKAILMKVCRDIKLPPRLIWPFLLIGARLFGGFDPRSASALDAVKHTKTPILLIHGEDDLFVPCAMGREIAAANPEKVELHTFPGAGHGLSFLIDREGYMRAVHGFLARTFGGAGDGA